MSSQTVESISRNQLKKLRNLSRKKARYKEREFLIEGERAVKQLIDNGIIKVQGLYFDEEEVLWESSSWSDYVQVYDSQKLSKEVYREITDTDNPQGVVARVTMPAEASTEELIKEPGTVVALDAIQDPGNLGTIIRSATWFGCRGLLVGKGTVDPFNPKVVRSTAGTAGVLPYQTGHLTDLLEAFAHEGWQILALESTEQALPLADVDRTKPTVVVAGNEARGIRPEVKKLTGESIHISAHGRGSDYLDSLNVAITTGITFYELTKD